MESVFVSDLIMKQKPRMKMIHLFNLFSSKPSSNIEQGPINSRKLPNPDKYIERERTRWSHTMKVSCMEYVNLQGQHQNLLDLLEAQVQEMKNSEISFCWFYWNVPHVNVVSCAREFFSQPVTNFIEKLKRNNSILTWKNKTGITWSIVCDNLGLQALLEFWNSENIQGFTLTEGMSRFEHLKDDFIKKAKKHRIMMEEHSQNKKQSVEKDHNKETKQQMRQVVNDQNCAINNAKKKSLTLTNSVLGSLLIVIVTCPETIGNYMTYLRDSAGYISDHFFGMKSQHFHDSDNDWDINENDKKRTEKKGHHQNNQEKNYDDNTVHTEKKVLTFPESITQFQNFQKEFYELMNLRNHKLWNTYLHFISKEERSSTESFWYNSTGLRKFHTRMFRQYLLLRCLREYTERGISVARFSRATFLIQNTIFVDNRSFYNIERPLRSCLKTICKNDFSSSKREVIDDSKIPIIIFGTESILDLQNALVNEKHKPSSEYSSKHHFNFNSDVSFNKSSDKYTDKSSEKFSEKCILNEPSIEINLFWTDFFKDSSLPCCFSVSISNHGNEYDHESKNSCGIYLRSSLRSLLSSIESRLSVSCGNTDDSISTTIPVLESSGTHLMSKKHCLACTRSLARTLSEASAGILISNDLEISEKVETLKNYLLQTSDTNALNHVSLHRKILRLISNKSALTGSLFKSVRVPEYVSPSEDYPAMNRLFNMSQNNSAGSKIRQRLSLAEEHFREKLQLDFSDVTAPGWHSSSRLKHQANELLSIFANSFFMVKNASSLVHVNKKEEKIKTEKLLRYKFREITLIDTNIVKLKKSQMEKLRAQGDMCEDTNSMFENNMNDNEPKLINDNNRHIQNTFSLNNDLSKENIVINMNDEEIQAAEIEAYKRTDEDLFARWKKQSEKGNWSFRVIRYESDIAQLLHHFRSEAFYRCFFAPELIEKIDKLVTNFIQLSAKESLDKLLSLIVLFVYGGTVVINPDWNPTISYDSIIAQVLDLRRSGLQQVSSDNFLREHLGEPKIVLFTNYPDETTRKKVRRRDEKNRLPEEKMENQVLFSHIMASTAKNNMILRVLCAVVQESYPLVNNETHLTFDDNLIRNDLTNSFEQIYQTSWDEILYQNFRSRQELVMVLSFLSRSLKTLTPNLDEIMKAIAETTYVHVLPKSSWSDPLLFPSSLFQVLPWNTDKNLGQLEDGSSSIQKSSSPAKNHNDYYQDVEFPDMEFPDVEFPDVEFPDMEFPDVKVFQDNENFRNELYENRSPVEKNQTEKNRLLIKPEPKPKPKQQLQGGQMFINDINSYQKKYKLHEKEIFEFLAAQNDKTMVDILRPLDSVKTVLIVILVRDNAEYLDTFLFPLLENLAKSFHEIQFTWVFFENSSKDQTKNLLNDLVPRKLQTIHLKNVDYHFIDNVCPYNLLDHNEHELDSMEKPLRLGILRNLCIRKILHQGFLDDRIADEQTNNLLSRKHLVLLLDSNILWSVSTFERMLLDFRKHPTLSMIGGNVMVHQDCAYYDTLSYNYGTLYAKRETARRNFQQLNKSRLENPIHIAETFFGGLCLLPLPVFLRSRFGQTPKTLASAKVAPVLVRIKGQHAPVNKNITCEHYQLCRNLRMYGDIAISLQAEGTYVVIWELAKKTKLLETLMKKYLVTEKIISWTHSSNLYF